MRFAKHGKPKTEEVQWSGWRRRRLPPRFLAMTLGIPTENTAKWIDAHTHNGWVLKVGELMIVDEASLAGTLP